MRADSASSVADRGPRRLRIAIFGDRVPDYPKHDRLEPALRRAATNVDVEFHWIPTRALPSDTRALRAVADAAVVAPQSPEYCRDDQALMQAIRSAREADIPCLAVCGGAWYALRAATDTRVAEPCTDGFSANRCAIEGGDFQGRNTVRLASGTRAARVYGLTRVEETFACTRSLDPATRPGLLAAGIVDCGHTPGMGPTLFEWSRCRYHLAALFLPHWRSDAVHPLFAGLLREAARQQPGGE